MFAAANASIGCQINGGPTKTGKACLPYVPHGPGGEVVTDSFSFVRQPLTGNGSITARVTSLTGEHADISAGPAQVGNGSWRRASCRGPRRESSSSRAPHQGSAYAAMMVTGSNGVRMQYNYTGDIAGPAGPACRRRTRAGCG